MDKTRERSLMIYRILAGLWCDQHGYELVDLQLIREGAKAS